MSWGVSTVHFLIHARLQAISWKLRANVHPAQLLKKAPAKRPGYKSWRRGGSQEENAFKN